jgi:hypothetical protein
VSEQTGKTDAPNRSLFIFNEKPRAINSLKENALLNIKEYSDTKTISTKTRFVWLLNLSDSLPKIELPAAKFIRNAVVTTTMEIMLIPANRRNCLIHITEITNKLQPVRNTSVKSKTPVSRCLIPIKTEIFKAKKKE